MKNKIICKDIKNNKIEVNPKQLKFRPSVYGVLIKDKKILLSRQWDGYDFPGGGVNIDETLEEACKREFFEETGINIKVLNPVHCETSFFCPSHSKAYKNEYWNCPLIYFLVEVIGGDISKENFDEEEKDYADIPEWIDLDKIDEIKYINSIDSKAIIKLAMGLLRIRKV